LSVAKLIRTEVAARIGPIFQIERVRRISIRGDIRWSWQSARIAFRYHNIANGAQEPYPTVKPLRINAYLK
jgi:hypothetical protein